MDIYRWPWREYKIEPDFSIVLTKRAPRFNSLKNMIETIPASKDTIHEKIQPLGLNVSGIYYSPDFNELRLINMIIEHKDIEIRKLVDCLCVGVPSPEIPQLENKFELKEALIISSELLNLDRSVFCLVQKEKEEIFLSHYQDQIIRNAHDLYISKKLMDQKNISTIYI